MPFLVKTANKVLSSTLILSAVCGLLATLSFAPFNWPVVGWFALWPIFIFAKRYSSSVWRLIGSGLLIAFFICAFAFYWTVHLFVVYGGLPLWMSLFVFAIHTVLLNLKIPLLVVALGLLRRKRFRKLRVNSILLVALIGTLFDKYTPQIFNWYWGNIIAGNEFLVQIADIVGIHGITFLFFVVSYAAYRFWSLLVIKPISRQSSMPISVRTFKLVFRKPVYLRYGWVITLWVVWIGYGVIQKYRYESIQSDLPKARIAAIQPDAPLEKYGESRLSESTINNLIANTIPMLTEEAFQAASSIQPNQISTERPTKQNKLDLIVLPESAVPYYTTQDNLLTRRNGLFSAAFESMIVQLATGYQSPVFFNEISIDVGQNPRTGQPRVEAYNSAPLFNSDGQRESVYLKRVLIAFGEQIPYATFLDETGLIELVPESVRYSRFTPGDHFVYLPYKKNHYFLPLICYEILDPEYVREFVQHTENGNEADYIVNITQDRWYGKTIETFQHYELGRIRAVEIRKAIVRSTNSGTSGMVDLAGNYAAPLYGPIFTGQEQQAVQVFDVPVHRNQKNPTLFVRFGNHWLWLPLLIWLITFLLGWRKTNIN